MNFPAVAAESIWKKRKSQANNNFFFSNMQNFIKKKTAQGMIDNNVHKRELKLTVYTEQSIRNFPPIKINKTKASKMFSQASQQGYWSTPVGKAD